MNSSTSTPSAVCGLDLGHEPLSSGNPGIAAERSVSEGMSASQAYPLADPERAPKKSSDEDSWADSRLISECLMGNERAWAALIEKYKRLIYSIPLKYGITSADAADIFQSVCLELFCGLRNLRKAESLKAWLMVVTSHKSFQWKKERRIDTDLETAEEQVPEAMAVAAPEILEEVEKEQCLRDGIAQLPSRCRELVQLLFYESPPLPYAEVARRLGLATGSIGFTRGRCLDKLQKILLQVGF